MPLNFRPWRAKKYNVSTKNSYVVCIHLLDNRLLECTLTAESTGHECLENISQRIELTELEYFGFRYVNKKLQCRWVELDKPLKKQLDKNAHSPLLYFGVMFYVANPHQLNDDLARYQYYLQLKLDVIEEKLPTTPEQAVLLAAYSLQAEFGEHDSERHIPEQMHDLVLLPRSMTAEERTLLELTAEVTNTHHSLQGMLAQAAELQYIIQARHLENYGIEYYPAKDETDNDLMFGASFFGVYVKYLNGQPTMYFKWSDVTKLLHNKRSIGIETSLSPKMVQFHLDDVDLAKYVHRMCSLQQIFYNETKDSINSVSELEPAEAGATGPLSDLQQSVQIVTAPQDKVADAPNVVSQSDPPAEFWKV